MIRRSLSGLLGTLIFACLMATPAFAQTPTRAAIDAACKPGRDPQVTGDESYAGGLSQQPSGLTPQHVPGATTVSAREAKCMVDHFGGQLIVIAAMDGGDKLHGAIEAGGAADDDPAIQVPFAKAMADVTGANKRRPILIYCHHERCFLSYNVALRTAQAGYTNVFWMRPGIVGWKKAGYAVVQSSEGQANHRTDPKWEHCLNEKRQFDAENSIQSCTALLAVKTLTSADRFDALTSRSVALVRSEDYRGAIADLNRALPLATKPRSRAWVLGLRAVSKLATGQNGPALIDANAAIAADPGYEAGYSTRSEVRAKNGDKREALGDSDRANQINPKSANGRNHSCWLRAADLNTELEKAAEDCNAAVQLDPKVGTYYDSRGMVALRLGRWQDAYDNYSEAIRLDSNEASAWYGRGLALSRKQTGDRGAADFAKAASLDPKIAETYRARGLVPGPPGR